MHTDEYEYYEEQFNPLKTDRKARRKRKPQAHHTAKKPTQKIVESVQEIENGVINLDFSTTYRPSKYEAGWLLSSLRQFYDQALITDVLALVKGGKEASVYRCQAHPRLGIDFVAAKVYRPRMFRSLKNDKMYREGRDILTAEGRAVKKTDHRIMRAVGKKSAFGEEVSHTSWLMYEFTTLQRLHQAGGAVPQPFSVGSNAILMSYFGDESMAAPLLNDVHLAKDEAESLFNEVIRNIDLMLQHQMIHGDLSAYNILYWEGKITLIDFPQVTTIHTNSNAYAILERDITRICEYFARQGFKTDPQAILHDFWQRYGTPPAIDWADTEELSDLAD